MKLRKKVMYVVTLLLSCVLCTGYNIDTITGDNGFIDAGGFDAHWPTSSIPLKLLIAPSLSPNAEHMLRKAAAHINGMVGGTLLVVGQRGDMPPIKSRDDVQKMADGGYVLVMDKPGVPDSADTRFLNYTRNGEMTACVIRLPDHPDADIMYLMAIHELGHALGLAHDDYDGSVMYPTVGNGHQKLTDLDIARLRGKYLCKSDLCSLVGD